MNDGVIKKCPVCGSTTRIGKILYGLPDGSEELMRRCENEEVYLGGCMILPGYPKFHCFECDSNIGKSPILLTKSGGEDYRRITTAIRFREEGRPTLVLEKKDGKTVLEVWTRSEAEQDSDQAGQDSGEAVLTIDEVLRSLNQTAQDPRESLSYTREMTEEEWKELLDKLYTELYLHEWRVIFLKSRFPEGKRWELETGFTKDRRLKRVGVGIFPPYWEELLDVLKPYYGEAGLS